MVAGGAGRGMKPFLQTFLRFGIVMDWHDGVCFTLYVTEHFIHQPFWPACIEPGTCDVHLPCFNTPRVSYLMLNTNDLLHVNTTFAQYSHATRSALLYGLVRGRWMEPIGTRHSRCAEAFKTRPPSFVSRILDGGR
jgi:hypothetical protein